MAAKYKALVIVESPAKARKISDYLGSKYKVLASMGHVRDLPSGAAEIPKSVKREPWSRIGINVDSEFEPLYIIPKGKKKVVDEQSCPFWPSVILRLRPHRRLGTFFRLPFWGAYYRDPNMYGFPIFDFSPCLDLRICERLPGTFQDFIF